MIEYYEYIEGVYADVVFLVEDSWIENECQADQLYAILRGWA